jgi:hypothetical protein
VVRAGSRGATFVFRHESLESKPSVAVCFASDDSNAVIETCCHRIPRRTHYIQVGLMIQPRRSPNMLRLVEIAKTIGNSRTATGRGLSEGGTSICRNTQEYLCADTVCKSPIPSVAANHERMSDPEIIHWGGAKWKFSGFCGEEVTHPAIAPKSAGRDFSSTKSRVAVRTLRPVG